MRRLSFLPVFLLLIIVALIDFYVFQGVKLLTSGLSPKLGGNINLAYWIFAFSIIGALIINVAKALQTRKFTLLFNTVFNAFLTIFITKLVFMLILFGEDVYRAIAGVVSIYPPRSETVSVLALAISAIPFFSFIFGVTRGKYHYKVRKTILYFDDLPESFEGFTITQISDIHSGSLDSKKGVQRGIDLINAQKSDLFVFTGDLVNNQATEIEPWIPFFSQIGAKFGKFSVLGNHDYGDYIHWKTPQDKIANLDKLKANHKKMNFRLLLDENHLIEKDGQRIALVGIENWGVGFGQRGNLNKALKGLDQKIIKILLSHDPSHWDAEAKLHPLNINLTLSGHTHGMQFGIEFLGFKWSPVKYRYPNWAGLAEENKRYLYVNRGFGFLGFSGRVGIWPEITVLELRRST